MSQRLLKRFVTITVVLFIIGLIVIPSDKAEAASYSSRYAWIDGSGNIVISVYDHKATNSYRYKTIGITVGRCVDGKTERTVAKEYITLPFNASYVTETVVEENNGFIQTTFAFPQSEILTRLAKYYPDWFEELQNPKGIKYIVIDSVMICSRHLNEKIMDHGILLDDGSRTGMWFGNTYWNTVDIECHHCGGMMPALMDGYIDDEFVSPTQICFGHPNAKDGY